MNKLAKMMIRKVAGDLCNYKGNSPEEFEAWVRKVQKRAGSAEIPRKFRKRLNTEIVNTPYGSMYHVTAHSSPAPSDRAVFFIHGGGYVMEALKTHWDFCCRLAENTSCHIFFPLYKVLPEGNALAANEFLLDAYEQVLKDFPAEKIVLMGDSAGGNLAIHLTTNIIDSGLPLPKELILLSPGVSFTCLNEKEMEEVKRISKEDIILGSFPVAKVHEAWRAGLPFEDKRSDVFKADVSSYPPVTIMIGTSDILYKPAEKYAQKLLDSGVSCNFIKKEKGFHDYALSAKATDEFSYIVSKVSG